jgi:3-methylcrotonyl-CoA carboxylase alpha subunit
MFRRLLIANRGEIACRVIRTCRRLGIETVAVFSDADEGARHVREADVAVRIGPPRPAESYLRIDRILDAARATEAQAIHPGYGFLSENADFARACGQAGIVFIGPTPEAIAAMGEKHTAKALMERAGVPVVPGYHGDDQSDATLARAAAEVGYPLLVKAVAGGGGRGMRRVDEAAEFDSQLAAARREAHAAFGDARVLIERYVTDPHHIEFQVFGDRHGNAVHLGERECSIQRRHQKVLEETPSPFLTADMRMRMGEAAVAAARAIHYVGAGTIEFIANSDGFYFMEMNTRLQVEHPVTELVTGTDLVEWQIRVAAGETLPLAQSAIRAHGHAIEIRLCAEEPARDFTPQTGELRLLRLSEAAPGVRVDSGFETGDTVGMHYDSLLAKVIVHANGREEARRRMHRALADSVILGIASNLDFLQRVVAHPAYAAGHTTTDFIALHAADLLPAASAAPLAALVAAAARLLAEAETQGEGDGGPWQASDGWRLNGPARLAIDLLDVAADRRLALAAVGGRGTYRLEVDDRTLDLRCSWDRPLTDDSPIAIEFDGIRRAVAVSRLGRDLVVSLPDGRHRFLSVAHFEYETPDEIPEGRLTALMPGRVVKLHVAAGDRVVRGQPLMTLEAMKMEHTVRAPRDGAVAKIHFAVDAVVPAEATLLELSDP